MAAPLGNSNHLKHGDSQTRLYFIWKSMRQRCSNPNNSRYLVYGAKGISVCKEWNKFENFKNWAMSNGYEETLTLDRRDNNKNYEPNNCRWATQKEQQRNRTNNVKYEYHGKYLSLADIAEISGVPYKKLWARINRGWSIEKATLKGAI